MIYENSEAEKFMQKQLARLSRSLRVSLNFKFELSQD